MIKELTENPEKEFKNKTDGYRVKMIDDVLTYPWYNSEHELQTDDWFLIAENVLEMEWEEVNEPVDFMTAVASGKRIKHEKWADFYELNEIFDGMSLVSDNSSRKTILGKWYVED